jgi:hypothetical protein
MNTTLAEQAQQEILRQAEEMHSKLPAGYEQTRAMYEDLLKRGIIQKRGFQLRSISDPPVSVDEPLYKAYLK